MYKTYEVAYVKKLQKRLALAYLIIGFVLGLAGFLGFQDWPGSKGLGGFTKKAQPTVESLTQAKIDSQVRTMIAKANPSLPYSEVVRIAQLEKKYAKKYGVPLDMGLAITYTESTFRPNAKSETGPTGLKQIAPSYWAAECNTTAKGLQEVDKNIECGYYVLSKLHRLAGNDWNSALRRYYGGTSEENEKYRLTVLRRKAKMTFIIS